MSKKNARRRQSPSSGSSAASDASAAAKATAFDADGPCPCGLGKPYAECCGVFHAGAAAPTAEALMRSRYSAYAIGDVPYLKLSWHPSTRPDAIDLDESDLRWTGLEILATTGGGPFADAGTVEFEARYTEGGRPGVLHENSAFVRVDGRWVYMNPVPPA